MDVADVAFAKSRLGVLLEHFARVPDARQAWKVAYPLQEVMFLAVCGTIADCDDFENIAAWGEAHLDFLRQYAPFHYGIPCADWLAVLFNRIDPDLFSAAFSDWVAACWPARPALIAIDGKTSRRTHDRAKGGKALHLVSAFAAQERLVLSQQAVDEKSNEITAIPELLGRIDAAGALVSIDAMGCNPAVAAAITGAGADYLLALKDNQPNLHGEVQRYFADAPAAELETVETIDKGHGRLEVRRCAVSRRVDWIGSDRAYPDAPRFPELAAVAMVEAAVESKGKTSVEKRYYISSRALSAKDFAAAVRSHWAIESFHWTLDVTFKDDLSRIRTGHGPKNMAVVRHFSFNMIRQIDDRKSLKTRRKAAGWSTAYLARILGLPAR
jgi:predicted transposase YbfD/YdcC